MEFQNVVERYALFDAVSGNITRFFRDVIRKALRIERTSLTIGFSAPSRIMINTGAKSNTCRHDAFDRSKSRRKESLIGRGKKNILIVPSRI